MIRSGDVWVGNTPTKFLYPCDGRGWIDPRKHTPPNDTVITAQMQDGRLYTSKKSAFGWRAVKAWQPAPLPFIGLARQSKIDLSAERRSQHE